MADRQLSSASSSRRAKQPTDGAVGQFVIDKEIGKGSFAQVYSGRHKVTGALVAIKSVELSRLNKKLKENLYGEIKILKTLRHPHIVALHDCVESATHINLIMEYCELGDLSLFIKKREKLITHSATHDIARRYPIEHNQGLHEVITRHFLKQLASALKFLREGNFVHRDVKPQNLLLLPSPLFRETHKSAKQILSASYDSLIPAAGLPSLPMLKLADFGFARVLPSTSLAETLCGSPLYMAPEILRYERYDAKADLWSVGTVLYEMATGRPPFRAGNHVELLRKIEAAEDQVRFPRESVVSPELKGLIRALLKRNPVERISFADFFNHPVITGPIPNLHVDDLPKPEVEQVKETGQPEGSLSLSRRDSLRGQVGAGREPGVLSSPKPRPSSPLATPIEKPNPLEQVPAPRAGLSYSPTGEGLGITRRPAVQPSTSAPARPIMYVDRSRANSTASQRPPRESIVPDPAQNAVSQTRPKSRPTKTLTEEEKAAQDVALERDYIFIDKKGVEVNALADQISMYPQSVPKSGQIVRRATQQGHPTSTTGAISARNNHLRQGSYDKPLSSSPGSTTSAISKAIQDASLRLFGFNVAPHLLSKGQSPPQIYSPFPAYPTPSAPAGLISDGKQTTPVDEDSRVAQCIEDWATRSDVVYGFAEVKYKQLVPMAPSMDYGLGGVPADKMEEEDGLTIEATVSLSEEALVLYVKALSLLAKSMDIASLWWTRKSRSDNSNSVHSAARDSVNSQALALKINRVVQWIRSRFNEVLEKAEIVRLKLIEAQKQLPEDHPSHPSNHQTDVNSVSGAEGVILSPGISAEKLMYDRAVEMSRTAAINEIASEDLPGCEIFYSTAIRMLEAVLDSDDDHLPKRRISTSSRDEKTDAAAREDTSEMSSEDKQSILKMIQMVKARLANLQKKMLAISRAQQQQQQDIISVRRRSGELGPRSIPV
ncbi:Serine/threonine-protein kinase atg1 [Apiosordaria backusii]|uniref:non-specific serine/threonine protein kinase n=1 Tax=Apiosordaria backusii TaxID=314023 RepID=A0AA40F0E9_9PEZI|nr:Serine/threonine-protein kinase atg1 [Apiosordaria backusii]